MEFTKKWGELFEEFQSSKGFYFTLFYSFFSIRRIAFVLAQVLLNKYLYVQAGLNIVFTLILLVYLFVYFPYKEIEVQISTLVGELCTVEVMTLSLFFVGNDDADMIQDIETAIVVSVIVTILIQCTFSLFLIGKQIRKICVKYRERKVCDSSLSESKVKVAPSSTTMNIEYAGYCYGDDTLNDFTKVSH